MREQAKSVSAFAANPLRARILIRELERKCFNVAPVDNGEKFDRYEHINRFTACHKESKKRFDLPRRPFFRWRKGEALPNLTTRRLIDGLFEEKLGSKWGGRGIEDPEQTLLVALDLISRNNTPNTQETLTEADEILATVNSSICDLIPKIPNLDKPKFTSYQGGKSLTKSADRKSMRYAKWSKSRLVAYPFIAERINSYDTVSPLCAALMYLVKPNNKTQLNDDLAQALLLDFISGVIAAYIVMLHRNPAEFQTGGLVVDLYRVVHELFFKFNGFDEVALSPLLGEFFNNHFASIPIEFDQFRAGCCKLSPVFSDYTYKFGLSLAEIAKLIDLSDPDKTEAIFEWWLNLN